MIFANAINKNSFTEHNIMLVKILVYNNMNGILEDYIKLIYNTDRIRIYSSNYRVYKGT